MIFALETDFSDRIHHANHREKILKYTQFCLRNGADGSLHSLYGVVRVYRFDDLLAHTNGHASSYISRKFFATRACMEFSGFFLYCATVMHGDKYILLYVQCKFIEAD